MITHACRASEVPGNNGHCPRCYTIVMEDIILKVNMALHSSFFTTINLWYHQCMQRSTSMKLHRMQVIVGNTWGMPRASVAHTDWNPWEVARRIPD